MKNPFVYFLFVLLVSFTGVSSRATLLGVEDSVGVLTEGGKTFVQYLVSPGETIYRISTHYGVAISELMEINPDLEDGLKAGKEILIPYRPELQRPEEEMDFSDGDVVHTVQPGETLYSLSRKYNVGVGDLLKWNGMELKTGQRLIVQKKSNDVTPQKSVKVQPDTPREEVVEQVEKDEKTSSELVKEVSTQQQATATTQPVNKNKSTVLEAQVTQGYRYRFDPTLLQVLVIPFDPHLYFSDADDEIAKESHIPRVKVREAFRRRLDALIDPPGYEVIHLMGGRSADSLLDLNRIYSSVNYNYQEILESEYYSPLDNHAEIDIEDPHTKNNDQGLKGWINKQKKKLTNEEVSSKGNHERFEGKYFGVQVKDPKFFEYFGNKYSVDYYVFINEFEVMTDYENCLDRSAFNYEREFVAHYSIFDKDGRQFAGNKFKLHYPSSSNDIMRIVADNVGQIAERIMNDLPKATSQK